MFLQPQQLYDIGVLGLYWLSEARDRETPYARSVSPLLYTLRALGLITEPERVQIMRNEPLKRLLHLQLHTCQSESRPERERQLAEAITGGTRHLVTVLPDAKPYETRKLVCRYGYKFYLTNAGVAYAESRIGPYHPYVAQESFVWAWEKMREDLAELMRKRGRRSGRPIVDFEDLDEDELAEVS